MDFKRLFPVLLIGLAIIILWPRLMIFIGEQLGYDMTARPTAGAIDPATGTPAVSPAIDLPASGLPAAGNPADPLAVPTPSAQTPGGWSVAPKTMVIADDAALGSTKKFETPDDFAIQLVTTPRGAGVASVTLNAYRATLRDEKPYTFEAIEQDSPLAPYIRPLATRQLILNGQTLDISSVVWREVERTSSDISQTVVYAIDILKNDQPALEVRKTFDVYTRKAGAPANIEDGRLGYEVGVTYRLINKTGEPVDAAISFNGMQPPPSESERASDAYFQVGWKSKNHTVAESTMVVSLKDQPRELLDEEEAIPQWIGASTTYFSAFIRPDQATGQVFASAAGRLLNPGAASRVVELLIRTKPVTVAAAGESTVKFWSYFGPRKREILSNAFYGSDAIRYDPALVIKQGPCGFCTFEWIVGILFAVLKAFHAVVRDWGLSIIGLVILVRLLLHPITRKSQLSMLKMSKLGPEFEKLKKKYGDDKQELARAQMQLMKQHGAGPLMGCLPMFLQMPIWIALWQALNSTFELRHEPFLYGLTWIKDLSKPDHLIDFANFGWKPVNLPFNMVFSGLNVLPIVLGITYYISMKITPQPKAMTPEQESQQKMIKWMTVLMFPTLFYGSPSGLCIYILTSTIIGIFESKHIRKQFERMEQEASKLKIAEGEVVTVGAGRVKPVKVGWFGRLQERAEQMQRELERQRQNQQKQRKRRK